jgi:hypothetical protein
VCGHIFGLCVDVGTHAQKNVDEVEMAFRRCHVEGGRAILQWEGESGEVAGV